MAKPTYPLINGFKYDYSSIEIDLGSAGIFTGITDIGYNEAVEPGEVRGTGVEKLGETRGVYTPAASMTLYKEDADSFIQALGEGYLEKRFDITVSYSSGDSPVITDKILGARITGLDDAHTQGSDALKVAFTLSVMRIERNGLKPFINMRT